VTRIKSLLALCLNLALATGVAAAIQGTSPSDGAKPPHADAAPLVQVVALASRNNHLTANDSIPDAPANRALYGKPLPHAGRSPPPDGN
jgi:hypothetical protein